MPASGLHHRPAGAARGRGGEVSLAVCMPLGMHACRSCRHMAHGWRPGSCHKTLPYAAAVTEKLQLQPSCCSRPHLHKELECHLGASGQKHAAFQTRARLPGGLPHHADVGLQPVTTVSGLVAWRGVDGARWEQRRCLGRQQCTPLRAGVIAPLCVQAWLPRSARRHKCPALHTVAAAPLRVQA
eukprot:353272-Chlamydomonas_euryale.AAC.15